MFAMKNCCTFRAGSGHKGGMTRDDAGYSREGSSEPSPPWVSAVRLVPHAFPASPAGGWVLTAKRASGCVAQ